MPPEVLLLKIDYTNTNFHTNFYDLLLLLLRDIVIVLIFDFEFTPEIPVTRERGSLESEKKKYVKSG